MSFIWPLMLFSLLLIPLFVWLYLRLQRRRQAAVKSAGLALPQGAGGSGPGMRRHIPAALFLSGLAILMVAMARPQAVVNLPRVEGTLILAFDISGSMAADDLKPTRMEAAKAAARGFVQRQPSGVQIGVVAFSESGMAVQAPTNDEETILAAIDRLAPERSTSLGQGILASLDAMAKSAEQAASPEDGAVAAPTAPPAPMADALHTPGIILLISDGENTAPPDPFGAAQAAAERGVRIYTVGIGSAAGTTLEVNGFTVHTQLDEATLKQIAELTDGAYYNAENEQELQDVYENIDLQFVIRPEEMEVTSIFAGAGILVFLIGGIFSLLWFSRLP